MARIRLRRQVRSRRSRVTQFVSATTCLGLSCGFAVAVLGRSGDATSQINLSNGSAWFPSPDSGSVSLVDGTTVTRVATVPVAEPHDDIDVEQVRSSAYVLNRTKGQLVRVDGATLRAGDPVPMGTAGDRNLAVRSNGTITWAVERAGTIAQRLDPLSLLPLGSPVAFPGNSSPPVLGHDGTLWMVDGRLLRSLRDGKVRSSVELNVGTTRLVMASGQPVVLDETRHRAIPVNPESGRPQKPVCFDTADPRALVAGSTGDASMVMAVSPSEGTLLVSDLRSGSCRTFVLGDAGGTDRYGTAVEADRRVYVPDYAAGTVIVLDGRTGRVLARPQVDDPNTFFVLLAYHGYVWFNNSAASKAGVVTVDGAIAVSTAGGDPEGRRVRSKSSQEQPSPPTPGPPLPSPLLPPPVQPQPPVPPGSEPLPPPVQPQVPPGPEPLPPPVQPQPQVPPGPEPPDTENPGPPPTQAPSPPTFTYSPRPAIAGKSVSFTDTSVGDHTIASWTFAAGNVPKSSEVAPTVTWASPGSYSVTLTINRNGSASSTSQQVEVVPPDNVSVPDVTGMTVSQATSALQAANLAVGGLVNVYSFIGRGAVAYSTPTAGSSVPKDTPINLSLSVQTGPIATYTSGLSKPSRLSMDASGSLYVAAFGSNEVIRVTASASGGPPAKVVVAGTGTKGHTGDGGLATAARLDGPISTAVDPAGNLYIAEAPDFSGGGSIRKVTPAGVITTLTNFRSPWDLTYYSGQLYAVGRFSNCVVATVNTTTGFTTNIVGTPGTCVDGPTTLSDPGSVTFDPAGGMYITEPHANIIVKFLNGALTKIVGTGNGGYSGDDGPALMADIHDPDDIAFDSRGNMFFTDWSNVVVREVTPDGVIRTVAGTGVSGYSGDGGPANQADMRIGQNGSFSTGLIIDGADRLFVSDTNNDCIRSIG